MGYDIEVRDLPEQHVAVVRTTTTAEGVGAVLHDALPAVFGHVMSKGLTPTLPPFTRYHSMVDESFDLEAGIGVAAPIEGDGRIQPSTLPDGRVATTTHVGPYEGVGAAHRALEAWAAEHGETVTAAWEVYVTDPGEEPDQSKWRTEVFAALA